MKQISKTCRDDITSCVEFPMCVGFLFTDKPLGEWERVPVGNYHAECCVFARGLTRRSWGIEDWTAASVNGFVVGFFFYALYYILSCSNEDTATT